MRFPTIAQWSRQVLADGAKRVMDTQGGWDAINRKIPMPQTPFGRFLAFLGLSFIGATADQNLSDNTLAGKVIKEVVADAASEFGSPRRYRNIQDLLVVVPHQSTPLLKGVADAMDEISAWLDKRAR